MLAAPPSSRLAHDGGRETVRTADSAQTAKPHTSSDIQTQEEVTGPVLDALHVLGALVAREAINSFLDVKKI